jgi:hypothetical protein
MDGNARAARSDGSDGGAATAQDRRGQLFTQNLNWVIILLIIRRIQKECNIHMHKTVSSGVSWRICKISCFELRRETKGTRGFQRLRASASAARTGRWLPRGRGSLRRPCPPSEAPRWMRTSLLRVDLGPHSLSRRIKRRRRPNRLPGKEAAWWKPRICAAWELFLPPVHREDR